MKHNPWWVWFNRAGMVAWIYLVANTAWQHDMFMVCFCGVMALGNASSWWTREIHYELQP